MWLTCKLALKLSVSHVNKVCICMYVCKPPATKGFTIVHCRLWNMVHESNLNWNRCILHVLDGYRVISIIMWLFRGLHKVTILHVLKEPKNCTESAFENSSISCIVKTMQESGVWRHFGDHLIISVSDFSLRPSWIFPKRSANDFGWNLLHVRLK